VNFPTYDQFSTGFRFDASLAPGLGMPLGGPPDLETYREQFCTWVHRAQGRFSPAELSAWPEPSIGSPTIVEYQGYRASVLYIKNFAQAFFVRKLVEKHRKKSQGLRMLEIGAGFGGVGEILLRMGVVSRYTVVDLPENLFLSAQYLPLAYPGRSAVVCDRMRPETFGVHDLRFVFPNDITLLEEEFDLVLNTASLGEMVASTARAYITWVSQHLSDGGLFISHNASNVRNAPEVVQRQSEYGYDQFTFERVYAPNTLQAGPVDAQHLVLVLSKLRPASQPQWTVLDQFYGLLNMGLNRECEKIFGFLNEAPSTASRSLLEALGRYFATRSGDEKHAIASLRVGDEECDLALEFLQGVGAFLARRREACDHFLTYVERGQSPMALATASLVLGRWDQSALTPAQEKVFYRGLTKVPTYIVKALDRLKLAAAEVKFARYGYDP
jgi:hypothetical protein